MSGGARVALGIALASKDIAGVIASSAGYPDSRVRKTLTFPLFATAGTDDFNHLEMRRLDRELSTTHRLVIFTGGHVWLSSDLALQAVEWMELQAMKAGLEPRDNAQIDRLFASRVASVDMAKSDVDTFRALRALSEDFQGLKDVSNVRRSSQPNWAAMRRFAPRCRASGMRTAARRTSCGTSRRWRPVCRLTVGLQPSTNFACDGAIYPHRRRIRPTRHSANWRGGFSAH